MNKLPNTNRTLEKLGGLAAIYGALVYILTMIVFLVILDYPNLTVPADKVAMIVNHQTVVVMIHWLSYILFGLFLVILSLALYETIGLKNSPMMKIATVFAVIWATLLIASGLIFNQGASTVATVYHTDPEQAVMLWQGIEVISSALSFIDGELLGGLWMLLIGISAWKTGRFHKVLNIWSMGIGTIGIISIIPFLNTLSAVFGLGQILWFIGIGLSLLKRTTKAV